LIHLLPFHYLWKSSWIPTFLFKNFFVVHDWEFVESWACWMSTRWVKMKSDGRMRTDRLSYNSDWLWFGSELELHHQFRIDLIIKMNKIDSRLSVILRNYFRDWFSSRTKPSSQGGAREINLYEWVNAEAICLGMILYFQKYRIIMYCDENKVPKDRLQCTMFQKL
jgi:hypothetical protein